MQIKEGQRFALIKLCQNYIKSRNGRLFLVSKILDKEVKSFSELSIDDWQLIRNLAYENWYQDDWTIDTRFANLAYKYAEEYELSLGQGTLF